MTQLNTKFRILRNYLIALTLFGIACSKGDSVPAYIVVQNPSLTTRDFPVDEGTSSSDISYAWAFVNDQPYGPWELPARIPVLDLGDVEVKIIAGIERNGSTTDLLMYPFFATNTSDQSIEAGDEITIEPVYEYFENLTFWQDDFDGGNLFTVAADSDTIFEPSGAMTFEGNNSGAIFLDNDRFFFEAQTNSDFDVPNNGPTFVELNYASDQTMLIGAYITFNNVTTRVPIAFITPSQQDDGTIPWKKIYIDMSPVWANSLLTDRELFIAVTKDSTSPSGAVFIDNVKVVHREL